MSEFLTLTDLEAESGIPARTIRFYIARGLLEGPVKSGRGAVYTARHLERLEQIKKLQSEGRTLSEIGGALAERGEPSGPAPEAWWRYKVDEDVVVWVKAGQSPWRTKQVREAIEEFMRRVGQRQRIGEDPDRI